MYAITCQERNGIFQAMVNECMESSRSQDRLTSVVHARGWRSSDRSLGLRLRLETAATSSSASPCGLEHKQPRSPNTVHQQQHRLAPSPVWPCHTLSITTLQQAFIPQIRQDVQKQLRQRLRHIVSQLVIRDASQDSGLTLYSSPQGRIFQVEYAQEAVKQGSVVVGIVSKTHAVLAAIKVSLPSLLHLG